MLKADLRKIYLGRQKALASLERSERSRSIAGIFFRSFDVGALNFLHCFLPIAKHNEIDTSLIFERVWRDFPQVETFVPRVDFQTSEIENVKFSAQSKLKKNRWEIDEPELAAPVAPSKIDAALIPLLCFDARGFRVGYGKGFYDKLLSKCRPDCLKIGLSYFAPVPEISDINRFDVKLDFCITPRKIFTL